ncbi:putative lipoprotein [Yersinia massiliensis]|uniref:LPS-assembly lipoprotein LptM n=1 Tax=Yersinia intermedia TaxID=631 RepID=A0A0H5LY43_YERIN|nr:MULTISPECIES: lipoprotein [Yersinia]MCB5310354.1 lipoprotein [Yersinia massiliensis]CNI33742.1 putative lipoprotein [Yersinia massiliensis]CRY56069.1 putative lipoprotein [Yersinia intermedia]
MKKELCWPLVAMMVLTLSGCGLKGPLYFPPSDKPKTETTKPDSGQIERNQQDLSGAKQSQTIAGPQ